ncbi:MAG: hypothetical protein KJ077_10850 [Anaerolineae bacterium]|nr:hypothetical protein [Anaerolineae bacterium]
MKKYSVVVHEEFGVGDLAAVLVRESIWFEMTPLPNGFVQVSVKPESAGLLDRALVHGEIPTQESLATLAMLVRVTYNLNGENVADMAKRLESLVDEAYADGRITGESEASVLGHLVSLFQADEPVLDLVNGSLCADACGGPVYFPLFNMPVCASCQEPVNLVICTPKE